MVIVPMFSALESLAKVLGMGTYGRFFLSLFGEAEDEWGGSAFCDRWQREEEEEVEEVCLERGGLWSERSEESVWNKCAGVKCFDKSPPNLQN